MKNKKFCMIVFMLMIVATIIPVAGAVTKNKIPCDPIPHIRWDASYGGELIDWGNCIQQTSDGGFIISGTNYRNAWSLWYSHFYLIKIDANGNEEWSQIYGPYNSEHVGKCVQETSDGGYIVAGFQGVTYQYDAVVQKTDSNGNIVWSYTFGETDKYDIAQSVQQTSDGGYIITGWTSSFGSEGSDALLLKIDADGNQEWFQTLGGAGQDSGNCVKQTSDGGFIVVGETESFGDNGDVYLVKTDSSGNEEWYQTFGADEWDGGYSIDLTSDGGYIITGWHTTENWDTDVYLIKTDSSGNEEWSKYFGGSDYDEGYSVQQTSDGGYFITGLYTDPENYDPDVYLIKTDSSGNEEWNKIIDNGDTEDIGNYGIQTSNGEYIITGYTGFYIDEVMDVWVIKLGIGNEAPDTPTIDGSTNGNTGIEYNYTFTVTDPDGDNLFYYISWGDGTYEEWIGPYKSGEVVTIGHTWAEKGTYEIKAKVKDTSDVESDWGTLEVIMPKTKMIDNSFIQLLLEKFPNAFPVLRYLLNYI